MSFDQDRNVIVGRNLQVLHNHCIVIGEDLKTSHDFQLLLGRPGRIVVDKRMIMEEWLTLFEVFMSIAEPMKQCLDNLGVACGINKELERDEA